MASKTVYLIDTENVGIIWKELLTRKSSKDRIVLFFTDKSPHISYVDLEFICQYPDTFEMIQCYTGKNGLDFQLVSYLGFLLKSSAKTEYVIVSNDCGFDSVIKFWTDREAIVSRKAVSELKKLFQKKPAEITQASAPSLLAPEDKRKEGQTQQQDTKQEIQPNVSSEKQSVVPNGKKPDMHSVKQNEVQSGKLTEMQTGKQAEIQPGKQTELQAGKQAEIPSNHSSVTLSIKQPEAQSVQPPKMQSTNHAGTPEKIKSEAPQEMTATDQKTASLGSISPKAADFSTGKLPGKNNAYSHKPAAPIADDNMKSSGELPEAAPVPADNHSEIPSQKTGKASSIAVITAITEYLPSEYDNHSEIADTICTILQGNTISKLQKIYQSFTKKFGHVKGTQLYQAVKPHIKSLYVLMEQQL